MALPAIALTEAGLKVFEDQAKFISLPVPLMIFWHLSLPITNSHVTYFWSSAI
ncbi:MAG TPA: hypothetical protein PLX08_06720 [Bacteroidales bacterium]|nr:hypothetical protein [Bacteroidales bacterium]